MTLPLFETAPIQQLKSPELRPYQSAAIETLRKRFAAGTKRMLCVAPIAAGKSFIVANIIKSSTVPVLFVAHRMELVDQCVRELQRLGIHRLGVMRGQDERTDPDATVQVASIQTLARRDKPKAGIVLIDECFPAGTMIDGQPIESIRVGDFVQCFDEAGIYKRRVLRTFSSCPIGLVRLFLSNGISLVATPKHKIWTPSGWTRAIDCLDKTVMLSIDREQEITERIQKISLRRMRSKNQLFTSYFSGSLLQYTLQAQTKRSPQKKSVGSLPGLQKGGPCPGPRTVACHSKQSLLLQKMQTHRRDTSNRRRTPRIRPIFGRIQQKVRFSANDQKQPYAPSEGSSQSFDNTQSYGLETTGSWRQWSRTNRSRTTSCFGDRMALRSNCYDRKRIQTDPLQVRHCSKIAKNSDRSRWGFTLGSRCEKNGCPQRKMASWARVDRVEILEQGSDGTFGGLCPDGLVYNIEVEEKHTYFANGVAVSNCHRAQSDSYVEHIFDHYKDAIIIGFTASPTRLDGRPLGNSFQTLDVVATYAELIKSGFVVEPDLYGAEVPIDLSQISIVAGDYNETQLGDRMNRRELVGSIVEHWLRLAEDRKTFCFAVNLDHSKAIVARFLELGVRAAHLDGTTPEEERREMLQRLDRGELQVVSSCNVLLEGVDLPSAKCVIHARPTKSLVLWIQSCGRIGRPWCSICRRPCKEHPSVKPIIIDHAKNFDEHGSPFEDRHWSLTQRATRMVSVPPMKICRQCFAYVLANQFTCPHCKYEFPAAAPGGPPKESPEVLVKRSLDPEELKQAFFDKMVALARSRGYKPGFAAAKFKEHYGSWPPRAWSDEVTSKFASDLSWQVGVDRRAQMKGEIRENPVMDVGTDPAGLGGEEPEETMEAPFADWLEEQGI